MRVRIQVIKVYEIEVDTTNAEDTIDKACQMQTSEIEATGTLIDAMIDHAETEEEVATNVRLIETLRRES